MQNSIIKNILNKISQKYPKIDTILLFGSALNPDWTEESDIDLYFIDNNINDGRIDLEIDSVKIEIQTDNFNEIRTFIEHFEVASKSPVEKIRITAIQIFPL